MKRLLVLLALFSSPAWAQQHLGTFKFGETVPVIFTTYGGDNESITITGLAVTDIEIYKRGSMTQRASDSGYALLDSDGIDIDSVTGLHGFTIDTSDNTTAGFWEPGGSYTVVVNSITVNSETVVGSWTFQIDPDVLAFGTAQSGDEDTIVLASWTGSIYADDVLNGAMVSIVAGTGRGQNQIITSYDADADSADVSGWGVQPDNTSVYVVRAASQSTVTQLIAAMDSSGIATVTDLQTELSTTASTLGDSISGLSSTIGSPAGESIAADIAAVPAAVGARTIDGDVTADGALCYMLATMVNDSDFDEEDSEAEFFDPTGMNVRVTIEYTGSDRSTTLEACGS